MQQPWVGCLGPYSPVFFNLTSKKSALPWAQREVSWGFVGHRAWPWAASNSFGPWPVSSARLQQLMTTVPVPPQGSGRERREAEGKAARSWKWSDARRWTWRENCGLVRDLNSLDWRTVEVTTCCRIMLYVHHASNDGRDSRWQRTSCDCGPTNIVFCFGSPFQGARTKCLACLNRKQSTRGHMALENHWFMTNIQDCRYEYIYIYI